MFGDGITKEEKVCSFLMIGQSNMAGRGEFADVEPIQNERCYMLRMGRWQAMREPINPDRPIFEGRFHSGVSLGASFADEFAKDTGCEVGMIPCADGGTIIEQWQPGEVLYDHAVAMTKLAMRSSQLCGILWHQGESNCRNFSEESYRENFLRLMTSLRKDLGAEDLPIIIGEVSEKIVPEHRMTEMPRLNVLLHQLAKELPLCDIVATQDLPLKPDGLHFDAQACRELGKRYFQKYKEVLSR